MDTVFGFLGNGFAVVAADCTAARSIVAFQHTEDKVFPLDSHKLAGASGVAADNSAFLEYIQKNMKLYELENENKLNTSAAASFIRNELATALRKGPYQTNLVIAGYDVNTSSPSLYVIDYLASCCKVNFGSHGYASHFLLSVFDRDWKEGMNEEEAFELVRKCLHELRTRFIISQPNFLVKIVDVNGVRIMDGTGSL